MAVRAKFYVAEVHKYATAVRAEGWADPVPWGKVILRPALRGEDNKEWASSTPSGEFTMTVSGNAFPWFESMIGKDVSITLDEYVEG